MGPRGGGIAVAAKHVEAVAALGEVGVGRPQLFLKGRRERRQGRGPHLAAGRIDHVHVGIVLCRRKRRKRLTRMNAVSAAAQDDPLALDLAVGKRMQAGQAA